MNDNDLETILRRGGGRIELPADAAARVHAAMHQELDRALSTDAAVIALPSTPSQPARRPRHLVRVAAAVLLVAATAGLLLAQREPDTDEAVPAQEVPPPPLPPAQQPHLVACLDFIGSTSIDDRPWRDVLARPVATIPPDYLATLATAVDELLATSLEARIAARPLQAAAAEARSADPDLDLIVRRLESAEDILLEDALIPCLTASNTDQSSPGQSSD